jgi:hypothetical protein
MPENPTQPLPRWKVTLIDPEGETGQTLEVDVYASTREGAREQALDAWAKQYGERPRNPDADITRFE